MVEAERGGSVSKRINESGYAIFRDYEAVLVTYIYRSSQRSLVLWMALDRSCTYQICCHRASSRC